MMGAARQEQKPLAPERLLQLATLVLDRARSIVDLAAFAAQRGPAPDWWPNRRAMPARRSPRDRVTWLADYCDELRAWRGTRSLEVQRLLALAQKASRRRTRVESEAMAAELHRLGSELRDGLGKFADGIRGRELQLAGARVQVGHVAGSSYVAVLLEAASQVVRMRPSNPGPLLDRLDGFDWAKLADGIEADLARVSRIERNVGVQVDVGGGDASPEYALAMLARDESLAQLPVEEFMRRVGASRQTLYKRSWNAVRTARERMRQCDRPAGDVDDREPWQNAVD
ncbi:MAG: hypothetical protein KDC98_17200 [Planctomycetes bacterium]|nr:hypothetical protein [Planctomycetota bacterium]